MLEQADRHDLGSCAVRREGSTPSFPTVSAGSTPFLIKQTDQEHDDKENLNRMKIESKSTENHEATFEVSVTAEEFQPYKQQAARKMAAQAKIPGFRPGKAPYDIVQRLYGGEASKIGRASCRERV